MIQDPLIIHQEEDTIIFEENEIGVIVHIKSRIDDRVTLHSKFRIDYFSIEQVKNFLIKTLK